MSGEVVTDFRVWDSERGELRGEFRGLTGTDFEGDLASVVEVLGQVVKKLADEGGTGGSSVEGEEGVVAHLGGEPGNFLGIDVGKIGHHEIEFRGSECGPQIGFHESDVFLREAEQGSVFAGEVEGDGRDVCEGHVGQREGCREGEADDTRATAHIEDGEWSGSVWEAVAGENFFDQFLGFGSWDEGAAVAAEFAAHEFD